jgi:hypothetical protein
LQADRREADAVLGRRGSDGSAMPGPMTCVSPAVERLEATIDMKVQRLGAPGGPADLRASGLRCRLIRMRRVSSGWPGRAAGVRPPQPCRIWRRRC